MKRLTGPRGQATFLFFAMFISLQPHRAVANATSTSPAPPQCAMLFLPKPSPALDARRDASAGFTGTAGIVDAKGSKITADHFNGTVTQKTILIPSYINVYSMSEISEKINAETPKDLKAAYDQMIRLGETRLVALPRSLKMLDPLYETMPNFKPVLDSIKRSLALSIRAGEPTHFPPIILLGEPGVGKTFFASALAETLGTGYEFISMSNLTAGFVLSGADPQWSKARMGKVARAIIEKEFANPVIVLDEVDKASGSDQYDPISPLYQLWEKETAAKFRDEFLDVDIDTSHINWIATANSLRSIPKAILSRAMIFDIASPTEAQMHAVTANILRKELAKHPRLVFSDKISGDVFEKIKRYSPREIRKLFENAIGSAVLAERSEILPEDIDVSTLKFDEPRKHPMGFLSN